MAEGRGCLLAYHRILLVGFKATARQPANLSTGADESPGVPAGGPQEGYTKCHCNAPGFH